MISSERVGCTMKLYKLYVWRNLPEHQNRMLELQPWTNLPGTTIQMPFWKRAFNTRVRCSNHSLQWRRGVGEDEAPGCGRWTVLGEKMGWYPISIAMRPKSQGKKGRNQAHLYELDAYLWLKTMACTSLWDSKLGIVYTNFGRLSLDYGLGDLGSVG